MDKRETFNTPEQLFAMIMNIYTQKKPSSFLIDTGGLERLEGTITAIEEDQNIDKNQITVAGKNKILLEQIIGTMGSSVLTIPNAKL